ncbi:hypothetical protein NC651_038968 [Populus alba x Populus x berolinensis]|nr:hypothetical protein NC651_038968 [Populus alba x Populus x berolinensis]
MVLPSPDLHVIQRYTSTKDTLKCHLSSSSGHSLIPSPLQNPLCFCSSLFLLQESEMTGKLGERFLV